MPGWAIRNAGPGDTAAVVALLAGVFAEGPTARWLDPDPVTRSVHSRNYFAAAVDHAGDHGIVHVAVAHEHEVLGAAVWLPHAGPPPDTVPDGVGGPVLDRLAVLGALLAGRRPDRAHHLLQYLGVRVDRQGRGIGGSLLRHRHLWLDAMGVPAYLEASDARNRELYLRHGYHDLGAPIRLPDGTPIWPMWRS